MAAEIFAIYKALKWISYNLQASKVVICVDSVSALQSLTTRRPKLDFLVYECQKLYKELKEGGSDIGFQWTPAHCGITGNEKADLAAKTCSKGPHISELKPHLIDYFSLIRARFQLYLNTQWEVDRHNTFLGKHKFKWYWWPWLELKNRKLEIAMARLRLGHSRLRAHMHKIKLVDSPDCVHCKVPETIEHFLINCHRYYGARCILRSTVTKLGINDFNIHTLLGGGDKDLDVKYGVAIALMDFLLKTGKLNDL